MLGNEVNNIIAVIPARSGSKGVEDKNIKLLGGIPLIAYSIAAAKKSKLIDRVIVSVDYSKNSVENGESISSYVNKFQKLGFNNFLMNWIETKFFLPATADIPKRLITNILLCTL